MNRFSSLTGQLSGRRALAIVSLLALGIAFSACGDAAHDAVKEVANSTPATTTADASREGARIFEQYRALDKSFDSVTRMQVKIEENGGQSRDLEMRVSRKREADGRLMMFSEFIAPSEERDRNALITLQPRGEIEGMRYIQSNDSFATVKGATNEDSLFGMTVQEMVDGQPEKYDFRLVGEEVVNGMAVYRLEGKLKAGADSRFPRLVTLVAKDTYVVVGAEFYDNKNVLTRRVTVTELKQVNGYWTRMRWTIDNPAKNKRLDFVVKEVKYDQRLSPTLFTKENLKKTALKPL